MSTYLLIVLGLFVLVGLVLFERGLCSYSAKTDEREMTTYEFAVVLDLLLFSWRGFVFVELVFHDLEGLFLVLLRETLIRENETV